MSERDRDLLVELDAAGIAPFNLRVQAGLLPQGLFPAVSFRPDPAGDFRLTHQFSGKGIELLFGNVLKVSSTPSFCTVTLTVFAPLFWRASVIARIR